MVNRLLTLLLSVTFFLGVSKDADAVVASKMALIKNGLHPTIRKSVGSVSKALTPQQYVSWDDQPVAGIADSSLEVVDAPRTFYQSMKRRWNKYWGKTPISEKIFCTRRDFGTMCPQEYMYSGGGFCKAVKPEKEHCGSIVDMASMTVDERRRFAEDCDVHWRCVPTCQKDYSQSCPSRWSATPDGFCQSPEDYSVPNCDKKFKFEKYPTALEKFEYSTTCFVNWSCVPGEQPYYLW